VSGVGSWGRAPLRLSLRAGFLEEREKGRTPVFFAANPGDSIGQNHAPEMGPTRQRYQVPILAHLILVLGFNHLFRRFYGSQKFISELFNSRTFVRG
jgi:hypothetical protein